MPRHERESGFSLGKTSSASTALGGVSIHRILEWQWVSRKGGSERSRRSAANAVAGNGPSGLGAGSTEPLSGGSESERG